MMRESWHKPPFPWNSTSTKLCRVVGCWENWSLVLNFKFPTRQRGRGNVFQWYNLSHSEGLYVSSPQVFCLLAKSAFCSSLELRHFRDSTVSWSMAIDFTSTLNIVPRLIVPHQRKKSMSSRAPSVIKGLFGRCPQWQCLSIGFSWFRS